MFHHVFGFIEYSSYCAKFIQIYGYNSRFSALWQKCEKFSPIVGYNSWFSALPQICEKFSPFGRYISQFSALLQICEKFSPFANIFHRTVFLMNTSYEGIYWTKPQKSSKNE
jgi:hypothetical protein